jgi:hypothetical protein
MRKRTDCVWCVVKNAPQMKNGSSVQNGSCGRTGGVQEEIPDMCVQIAKQMFLRNGGDRSKLPQVLMQLAPSLGYVAT